MGVVHRYVCGFGCVCTRVLIWTCTGIQTAHPQYRPFTKHHIHHTPPQVLPPLGFLTFFIITWFIIAEAGKNFHWESQLPLWLIVILSCGVGVLAAGVCGVVVVPRLRQRVRRDMQASGVAMRYVVW